MDHLKLSGVIIINKKIILGRIGERSIRSVHTDGETP